MAAQRTGHLSQPNQGRNIVKPNLMENRHDYLRLEELSCGVIATSAINVSYKLGLFTLLNQSAKTVAELAAALEIGERPALALTDALTSIGILARDRAGYFKLKHPLTDKLFSKLVELDQLWVKAKSGDREALLAIALEYGKAGSTLPRQIGRKVFGVTITANIVFAQRYQLFEMLLGKKRSLTFLAKAMDLDRKLVCALLNNLMVFGLVSGNERGYRLTDLAAAFLDKDKESYFGNIISVIGSAGNKTAAGELAEAVRKNAPNISSGGDIWVENEAAAVAALEFAKDQFRVTWLPASEVAAKIDFSQNKQYLDIAGGPGAMTIQILRLQPHLRAVITDIAPTGYALLKAKEYGVADRLVVVKSNMFTEPFPPGADVVMLSQIIHDWPEGKNLALIKKIADYLPKGGKLLIHERLLDESRNGPLTTALQSLFMLIWTEGRQYTASELKSMLQKAGLETLRISLSAAGFSVIEAKKV